MRNINFFKLCFFIVSILMIFSVIIPSLTAFPPEGDCKDYHKVVKIIPYYQKTASINLDGVPDEAFWTEHTNENENGTLIIPLASESYGPNFFIIYLNITFILTDTDLFILCEWLDNSTKPDLGASIYDGLYFCWNINVPNFSAYFPSGMSTLDMGGGNVDSWDWSCLSSSPPNGSSYYCKDKCFGTYGWYDPSLETEDVKIAYTHKQDYSYTLEIRRKLITNDPYDIQFDRSTIYKFNMGIMDNGNHEDHAISYTHALDIKLPFSPITIPAFDIIMIISFMVIIFPIIAKNIKHRITKVRI